MQIPKPGYNSVCGPLGSCPPADREIGFSRPRRFDDPSVHDRRSLEGEPVARHRRRQQLGPLEVAVMDRLWDEARPLDVAEVTAGVATPRLLTRNTIHTTLERLVRKGLVSRERSGRANVYLATSSRRAWITEAFDSLVDGLGEADRTEVLAGFVAFAERTSESTLEVLQALVADRLTKREEDETD